MASENITFSNDFVSTPTGPFMAASITGTLTVDFTGLRASGTLTATTVGGTSEAFSQFSVSLDTTTNTYNLFSFAGGGSNDHFGFTFVGMEPSTVNQLDLKKDGINYTGNSGAVMSSPVCFAAGTLIRTSAGDVAVEALRVGDLAVTASGESRAIRWIGHRTVDCRRHPHPDAVMPIRIAAHAFAKNRPARDLFVSPGHAICVDVLGEVLIPAAALVNGTTIVRVRVDAVGYWHVELDDHDILLAENMPAESYLEMKNRSFFGGGGVVALQASPDVREATHADFCRPFHADGPVVASVRERLAARAAQPIARAERGCRVA